MKPVLTALCLASLTNLVIPAAIAAPVRFVFTGHVLDITVEDAAINPGIAVGDPVTYHLVLDADRLGTRSTWDGSQYIEEDVSINGFDSFHASHTGGFLIDAGLVAATTGPTLFNYGFSQFGTQIYMGSQDHGLALLSLDGVNWSVSEQAMDANGVAEPVEISSGGTLAAVPLPPALLLLGTVMPAFFRIRRPGH